MRFTHRLGRVALAAVLAVVALAVAATPGFAATPSKLTIAYQLIPNGDLVVKNQKWLEQALPDTKISWKEFASGGDVNTAVAAGAVDIGLAGSSPVSRGLSTKIDYKVPWIFDVIGTAEALVARNGVSSIKALKGKKIATPLASTSHYSLLAALQANGLSEKDVTIVDAEPAAITAAWKNKQIDAAYVWNPQLATLEKDGGRVLTDSSKLAAKGKATYDLAVVTSKFAAQYPEAVQTWLAAQNRAVNLYRNDRAKWAKAVGAELHLSTSEVLSQAKGLKFLTAKEQVGKKYLGGGLLSNLYAAGKFNKELKQIPSLAPLSTYTKAIYITAAKKVAAG